MLARVYLQKGDYANAADAADRVIKSEDILWKITYLDVFPYNPDNANDDQLPDPAEYIFSMQVTSSQGVNDFNTYFSTIGRGDIDINGMNILDLYEAMTIGYRSFMMMEESGQVSLIWSMVMYQL